MTDETELKETPAESMRRKMEEGQEEYLHSLIELLDIQTMVHEYPNQYYLHSGRGPELQWVCPPCWRAELNGSRILAMQFSSDAELCSWPGHK